MFIIPDGLRVGLEKLTGRLSEEEVDIYDSIKALEEVLRRPASLEVLRMYRQREIPRVYENYIGSSTKEFMVLGKNLTGELKISLMNQVWYITNSLLNIF